VVPGGIHDWPVAAAGERFEAFYLREFHAMVKLAYAVSVAALRTTSRSPPARSASSRSEGQTC
jgi:hypothetical protein